jgi:hypothetical protein
MAKSFPPRNNSSTLDRAILPASITARLGFEHDKPANMLPALTNSVQLSTPGNKVFATVVLPAPSQPDMMYRLGIQDNLSRKLQFSNLISNLQPLITNTYIFLLYCPPTSYSACDICPNEQYLQASIRLSKIFSPAMALCCSSFSSCGIIASLRC